MSMLIAPKIAYSMKKDYDKDIGSGSDTCPSCKSHAWKSAVSVVMEGTSNAKNTFAANASTTATHSGDRTASLLSDRWFSWDYPIEADIGLSSSTGLVQEVKRFLAEWGPAVQMPLPPTEPGQNTSAMNMRKETSDSLLATQPPTELIPSGIPVKPKEASKITKTSMRTRLSIVIVPSLVGLTGAYSLFGNDVVAVFSLLIIFASLMIVAGFQIRKLLITKMSGNESDLKEREKLPQTLEHYAKDRKRFQEEAKHFRVRYEKSERRLREYKLSTEATAIYELQLAEYGNKRRAVLKARERLWERTRLCIRCGTAYLGPG